MPNTSPNSTSPVAFPVYPDSCARCGGFHFALGYGPAGEVCDECVLGRQSVKLWYATHLLELANQPEPDGIVYDDYDRYWVESIQVEPVPNGAGGFAYPEVHA